MVTKSGSKSKSATFSEAAAMVVRRACFANFDTSYHLQHSGDKYGGCVSSVAFAQACKTLLCVLSLAFPTPPILALQ